MATDKKAWFIAELWDALQPARDEGFNQRALLAQIALETGWLEHVNWDAPRGRPSFNLFNMKSGHSWTGDVSEVTTHEYVGGNKVKIVDRFRSYPNYAASVADYIKLIKTLPRYQEAYAKRGDLESYPKALKSAGYATDPRYASSIIATARALPRLPEEEP